MKQLLRNRISKSASYFEILLSILILAGILIVTVSLVRDLIAGFSGVLSPGSVFDFRNYISLIMQLVISIEFVKMISKHTPESLVEVLLFVIARKIVIDETNYWEIAIGILAIAILFIIKKYFTQKTDPEGCILEGDTNYREMNAILGTKFTADSGQTAREIIMNEISQSGLTLRQGLEITLDNTIFKVYSIKNHAIDAIEAVPLMHNRLWRRFSKRIK
jgi:hypothetical protein